MPSKYAEDIGTIKTGMATLLERSENTGKSIDRLNSTVETLDKRVDDNSKDIAKLQERQSVLAGINTALTVIGTSFAAWIGLQR